MDMNTTELLTDLEQLGIEIGYEGDRLWCRPPDAVTPDLVERLRNHKAEVLAVLRPDDAASANIANRFNGVMHAGTAALIAANRPQRLLMQEPPSQTWIDENEANWCNAADADVDHMIGRRNWPTSRCWICDGFLVHSAACKELQASWQPVLEFGKHKGKPLVELPEDYLRWLLRADAIRDVDVRKSARVVLGIPEPVTEYEA